MILLLKVEVVLAIALSVAVVVLFVNLYYWRITCSTLCVYAASYHTMSVIIALSKMSSHLGWCMSFVFIDTMLFQMEWRETITYEICQERNIQGPIASLEIRYFFFNALDWIFLRRTYFWMETHTYIDIFFVFYFFHKTSLFVIFK